MTIEKYFTVQGKSEFDERVQEKIKEGYSPYEAPFFANDKYHQVMIKAQGIQFFNASRLLEWTAVASVVLFAFSFFTFDHLDEMVKIQNDTIELYKKEIDSVYEELNKEINKNHTEKMVLMEKCGIKCVDAFINPNLGS